LIIRVPGKAAERRVVDAPVTSCDLFPTILSLLGLDGRKERASDGVDITPWMTTQATGTRDLFFHYPHYYPTTSPVSAIRSGRWKLLHFYEEGRMELYDLESDLGEELDVADSEAKIAERLRRRLDQWLASVEAQLPEPNPARSALR
jgi:arylsulfatase A-like enzyme